MPSPAATFDEIRTIAASLPAGGFVWQPAAAHPRIVLYAATHGIAIGVSGGSPQAMTALVDAMVDGHGPLHALVEQADTDFKLYDLALDRPTRDSRLIQAIDEIEASRAAAYGMMAVEPGIDILVVAALGCGAELAATALATALQSGNVVIAGPAGTALARHGALDDPLELLGVILAARLAGIPVILDGIAAYAAAAVAKAMRPDALAHCRLATGEAAGFSADTLGIEAVLPGTSDSPLSGARALIAVMS
jgi:nicotinate-nucleotide--dimethylbenzimidazole phosphoribosyltransferase